MEFWCWLWWLTNAVVCCVGTAVVVRRLLVPWTYWLGRRALCWCRYVLFHGHGDIGPGQQRAPPACRCCGGVNFDGMAGSWAVVTGCTDGIGKEYAIQLADRGMNVALVSRNLHKLLDVSQQIDQRHAGRVKTKIIVADFTSSGGTVSLSGTYDAVRRGLGRLDVRLLVNNAGVGYARPERLLDLAPCCTGTLPDPCRDVIECNALATVAMCRIVMPLMVVDDTGSDDGRGGDDAEGDYRQRVDDTEYTSPKRGGGGVVINVSSVSARVPCPLLSVYGATKAFIEKFSVELAAEYDEESAKNQIAVRCLTPGFVATKMSRIRPTSTGDTGWTYTPVPRSYANHSLRSLDCHCFCGLKMRERAQTDRNVEGEDGKTDEPGWLARMVSVVFDSPSSPLSAGRSGVTTTGYPSHTFMLMAVNVVRWVFGDQYLSSAAGQMMCGMRNRIAAKMQKQKSSAEFENQSHDSGSSHS
ncbi:very-long-chain 3-oxoacyl-CoA reductase-B [Acyrthosiphon pisum]|uniref:Estradiol 17-beta-dehydrogenase 12 n=1 Tax=Acyrthosiphon pisum TaxID=7029 RepID=A0A8R1W369_ACYPI|nr:very-long-chain 3-oxoacyl-CoA reductase-B [Acyrthosiphon pisum]|eukprot:XP_001947749.1 PREDICTED: very-long-chain 3-oxoacyl-CoA reductase-B [Acyrthosiphon pisum]